jgi:hypothetical protein
MGHDGHGRRNEVDGEHKHGMVTSGLESRKAQPATRIQLDIPYYKKGSNVAANAIKVPLNDIRYAGGWSTNSTVMEAKYIDFAMPPSKTAYIFFGHLKRDTPAEP